MTAGISPKVRLDKWLWAARFFKTRKLAQEAIRGGKVHVAGERAKPARNIMVGEWLDITRGQEHFVVEVLDLSEQRGPASVARALYREDPSSRDKREMLAEQRKLLNQSMPRTAGKPDKHDRKRLMRWKTGQGD
ncbi:MAG: S4 domain-containing protein [Gammaproteobacteria bacterium]|nr:S4 domain-containing protein [Gammaproteobacteria bacterium]